MTDAETLRARLAGRGYQPAQSELPALFTLLATVERDDADLVERALSRLPAAVIAAECLARFGESTAPLRGRICRLVGRLAVDAADATKLRELVFGCLDDSDDKTRRNAIIALGKFGPEAEWYLLQSWAKETKVEMQRSLAASLGKVGSARAVAVLQGVVTDDRELRRITDEALLKLRRTVGRAVALGHIDPTRSPPEPWAVVAHCRHGLAPVVAEEWAALADVTVEHPERVTATLAGPVESLWVSRCMLQFAFPLFRGRAEPGEAVIAALSAPRTRALLTALTVGPVRYRIEWADAGHRRGLTFQVAAALGKSAPELQNDPTASLWEVVVTERPSGDKTECNVEIWPRGLADPRFAWRQAHVPASSHPTIAAALVREGGLRDDDIVWDPFTGAGTELVERAKLGPYQAIYGTDRDDAALDLARRNLASATIAGAILTVADGCTYDPPEAPTLIITNPPMGRRVLSKHETSGLYQRFLANADRVLAKGGRVVWITPRPTETDTYLTPLGLNVRTRRRIDMGGFFAELQLLSRRKPT